MSKQKAALPIKVLPHFCVKILVMKTNLNMKEFITKAAGYQVILPLELSVLIPKDDSVRMLSAVMEREEILRLAISAGRREKRRRIPALILLKVLVYGYMNKLYSSRGIESACRRDINFMWLLAGYPAPDHNTLARFRKSVDIEAVFIEVVKLLHKADEVAFENVFIDGTKFEANANRYTFVWKGSVEKHNARLLGKKEAFLEEFNRHYGVKFCSLSGVLDYLDYAEFVHGKGKRKSREQRDYETASELYEKEQKYLLYFEQFEGRKSFSKTDKGATFMRLKDDHMRNGQLKPAYNIQLAVESEYIVEALVSSERGDQLTFIPMLDKISGSYNRRHKNVSADAGYESEENYTYLKKHGHTSYIKPQNYEQRKKRAYALQIGRKENMTHDEAADIYTCTSGKRLNHIYDTKRKSQSGYVSTVAIYQCEDCSGCERRALCTQAQVGKNKQLQVSRLFEQYRQESLANIITEFGTQLRVNRSIQAEGAFGVLKEDYEFRRFLMRGKKNVTVEIYLLCLAYNLNKLHKNIQNGRLKFRLHELKKE